MSLPDLLRRRSWRRISVLVRHLPATSRSYQTVNGERWDRTDNLLAGIYDLLARANWQRGGNKRAPRPKPIPRPGMNPGQRFGNQSMPVDEWRRRYAARFPERGEDGSRARHGLHQPRPVS